MKITEDIRNAIILVADEVGGQSELSKRVGVYQSAVSKWLNKSTKNISNETWLKLHPLIQPYLSEVNYEIENSIKQVSVCSKDEWKAKRLEDLLNASAQATKSLDMKNIKLWVAEALEIIKELDK